MDMSASKLRIAIVGGGPSGLTLGILLHLHKIPFTIFERNLRPTEEELNQPSGSLDMHEESGLAALEECGLLSTFHSLRGDCTEDQKLYNKHGQLIYQDDGGARERPEISRHTLIRMLLDKLPESAVRWGHKLFSARSYVHESGTEIELDFGDNGKDTFDFVVGADGAWSKLRALLTNVKPYYSGYHNITLNIRDVTSRFPHLAQLIGDGTFTSLGDRHGVLSQRSVHDSARIYIIVPTDEEDFATRSGLKTCSPAQAKEFLLGDELPFSKWGANIQELVRVACDDEEAAHAGGLLNIKPLHMLPVGQSWKHQSGMTVIGDAAHLMCPWAGEGVNLAMKDALCLSRAIIQAYNSTSSTKIDLMRMLDPLVQDFETTMIAEAKVMAEETVGNGQMMFGSDDGVGAMHEFFKHAMPPTDI